MKTVCYIDVPEKENGHGVSVRKLHENEHVMVAHIKLNPGEKVNPHSTPVDVFFYILEGGYVRLRSARKGNRFQKIPLLKVRPGYCTHCTMKVRK